MDNTRAHNPENRNLQNSDGPKAVANEMKTKLYPVAMSTAALSLNLATAVGQVFTPIEASNNQAIDASPRAKEEFPWLARSPGPTRSLKAVVPSKSALAVVKENPALATSPRMKEQYPELARLPLSPVETRVATRPGINPLTAVRRNSALEASPRMKELYPELARGAQTISEIALLN